MVALSLILWGELHILAIGKGEVVIVAGDDLQLLAFEGVGLVIVEGCLWDALLRNETLAGFEQM